MVAQLDIATGRVSAVYNTFLARKQSLLPEDWEMAVWLAEVREFPAMLRRVNEDIGRMFRVRYADRQPLPLDALNALRDKLARLFDQVEDFLGTLPDAAAVLHDVRAIRADAFRGWAALPIADLERLATGEPEPGEMVPLGDAVP